MNKAIQSAAKPPNEPLAGPADRRAVDGASD